MKRKQHSQSYEPKSDAFMNQRLASGIDMPNEIIFKSETANLEIRLTIVPPGMPGRMDQ
jgi:hypothetical protein